MGLSQNSGSIVVTGAAGFLGSHLCDALLSQEYKVIGVDNYLTGRRENLKVALANPNFTFVEADVTTDPVTYLGIELKIQAVLHFASPASPPRYQEYPVETYLVNSYATHNLLQFLRVHAPHARFLFASTSEVYGDPLEHPQTETYWGHVNPNGVRSCYDEAKRLGETIVGVFNRNFGFDTRIVRIFNTYGPRMDPLDGRVLPNLITQALSNQSLTVYGDGEQTRSYCYYSDLVAGVLALLFSDQAKGETVNIGSQDEMSVLETAKQVSMMVLGETTQPNIKFEPIPLDDPTRRRPDTSKAKSLLGWAPKVNFPQGLRQTVEYFSSLT